MKLKEELARKSFNFVKNYSNNSKSFDFHIASVNESHELITSVDEFNKIIMIVSDFNIVTQLSLLKKLI